MQRGHTRRGSWFGKKEDLKLTPEQKRRSKMTAKVDPTKAITEEEPFAVSQSKVGDTIRTLQHKDVYGNPIVEPDLSNPTRYRWERPLETIRSFEAAINKDLRRQSAFCVVDQVDSMDQSQRQVHHNSGPFDPSLYHRNNGAQRYAPVDAYSRDVYSRNGSGYYYHGQSSQDSFDRQAGPHISQHSSRSNNQALMEQIPPLSHINSFGQPGQEGHSQSHGPRRAPETGLKLRGYAAAPGNVQDHYNYNSDPNSESSSFGGSNKTFAHGYDVNFGDVPLQLELSNQLDGEMPPGNGNPYTDGYSNPVEDQSRNPYRNSAMSSIQSRNPYRNSAMSPSQSQFPNTVHHAGNTEFSGNGPIIGSGGGHTSSGDVGKKAVPAVPAKITPPATVAAVSEPEIKKKKGLLRRLSKT